MNESGLVVARFRRHALVESTEHKRYLCQFQSRDLHPVVGDSVQWRREGAESGTLELVDCRSSELKRINSRGQPESVAANLSQLVIVLAASPTPDWFLLDRYLVAGELEGLNNIIIFNKLDISATPPSEFRIYKNLGYPVMAVSAREQTGLKPLESIMEGERSAIIGQSGVGKSSLTNALMGDALQRVEQLSDKASQGRHTTTTAALYRLPSGGELIDSPGVRDYSPFIKNAQKVQLGFREFIARSPYCRFDDCKHLAEPECAVKAALVNSEVASQRYESYKKLYELTETLQSRYN